MSIKQLGWALCALIGTIGVARAADAPGRSLTVFAAASLTDALTEIDHAFTRTSGVAIRASFASSSALARQIEAGARADVFFSADLDWTDYLQARSLLDSATRKNVVSNRLVLIAPIDSKVALKIGPNFPLAATLGRSRLATGDPESVPVGRYARSALSSFGVWNDIADRIVRTDNVRVALAYVARGEASLGIVYETDARVEKRVRIVDTFPATSHLPIVYPIAATRNASADAKAYLAFVTSAESLKTFEQHGFTAVK